MKTLIKALLGASMLMPVVAQAQDDRADRRERRMEMRAERGDRPQRAARIEARAQAQPQVQVQPQVQTQPQPQPQQRERRADRGGRGTVQTQPAIDQQPRQQVEQRQQRRFGARQEFVRERRDDRQDFARERRDDRQDRRAGTVSPGAFREDRRDDRQDYRADRRDDRQDFARDRQGNGQWDRGNDNRRDLRNNDNRRDYRGNDNRGDFRGNTVNQRQAWNRGWRNDNRYNWSRYRTSNRSLYRLPRYYAPYGWGGGYRRFGIGVTLSSILWNQNYWIDDPYSYRLPDAYGPYRWVRYYNDAMLVDIRNGRVLDVVHDIFY